MPFPEPLPQEDPQPRGPRSGPPGDLTPGQIEALSAFARVVQAIHLRRELTRALHEARSRPDDGGEGKSSTNLP